MVIFSTIKKLISRNPRGKTSGGFTLVEVVVTATVMTILTAVVIGNYPSLNNILTVQLIANDVALSLRQAQQYALGAIQRPGVVNPSISYGIHLDINSPQTLILFADVAPANNPPGDFLYTPSGSATDQIAGTVTLPSTVTIKALCAGTNAQNNPFSVCMAGQGVSPVKVNTLDIVFRRPAPDANVNGVPADGSFSQIAQAGVLLSTPDGSISKKIIVNAVGQISVQ